MQKKKLTFYMQSINLFLDLRKETRSSKGPKNRSEIVNIWNLDLFYEQAQKLKNKGKERSFLWMEHEMEEDSGFLSNEKSTILVGPAITKC